MTVSMKIRPWTKQLQSVMNFTINVSRWGSEWVAECLEYDIVAQASAFDDLLYEFERIVNVQMIIDLEHGRKPLSTCAI